MVYLEMFLAGMAFTFGGLVAFGIVYAFTVVKKKGGK